MTGARLPRILAVHPVSRGFGWVVFEGPLAPLDWGFGMTLGQKNETCLQKVGALIDKFLPETLVLEAFEPRYSNRSERMTRLGRALITLATTRGIDAAVFTRIDVKACFRASGAHTRHEIAQAVIRNIPMFQNLLPNKRRDWQTEKDGLAMFSAASLALTHFYLDTTRLFNDLKDQKNPEDAPEMD